MDKIKIPQKSPNPLPKNEKKESEREKEKPKVMQTQKKTSQTNRKNMLIQQKCGPFRRIRTYCPTYGQPNRDVSIFRRYNKKR